MADEKGTWKRFRRLNFDSKKFSRRARKAETTSTRHAHKFVLSKLDSLRSAKQQVIGWLLLIDDDEPIGFFYTRQIPEICFLLKEE